ncbi:hypothetical protein TcCL_ESM03539, partial [Trypanosoma cruzi]
MFFLWRAGFFPCAVWQRCHCAHVWGMGLWRRPGGGSWWFFPLPAGCPFRASCLFLLLFPFLLCSCVPARNGRMLSDRVDRECPLTTRLSLLVVMCVAARDAWP